MGKKYLDTKQSTIEAAVLDIWAKSSEEQEAIRNAAEMFVQEKTLEDAITQAKKAIFNKPWGQAMDKLSAYADKTFTPISKSRGQDFLDPKSVAMAKLAHKYVTSDVAKKAKENPHRYAKMQARLIKKYKTDPKKAATRAANVKGSKSSDPTAGRGDVGAQYAHYQHELEISEGWWKDLVDKKSGKPGAKASGIDSKKPKQPDKPKPPSIIDAIKNAYSRLFNGDYIGMTVYLNTLNEDQSSDQIAVIIGDINETELTLINPENLDQTTKINLENLQIDINEDGELEFSEAVDWRKIPKWPTDKTGKPTPVK